MQIQIENLLEELDEVLTRSHMTEEAYDYLQNIQSKLYRIQNNESFEELPKLTELEKY